MRALVCFTLLILCLPAQPRTGQLRFEVESVKRPDPNDHVMDFKITPGGSLSVRNWDLELLVQRAYGVKAYQIIGGPSWRSTDRFDIAAKAGAPTTEEQVLTMLRTLLEDRFALIVHREKREGTVYRLVTAKEAPKLDAPQDPSQSFVRWLFAGPPERRTATSNRGTDRDDADVGRYTR
jgi:uncharacterized protein (TIGR03435 family)